jgi:flagellar basal-body rod protein FlgG
MLRSLYTAATGMSAQELKMSVSAHNLANTNTVGFKKVRAEFEDLLSERLRTAEAPDGRGGARPAPLEVGLGVRAGATTRSLEQGDMMNTNNPLDVAIEGRGFLRVVRRDGTYGFTRAGNLRVDADGRMVTQAGLTLDPDIRVPDDASEIRIKPDGVVLATVPGRDEPVEVGAIELALFTNPAGLTSLGGNLLEATPASGVARMVPPGEEGAGQLAQGYLEGANVKAVEEMIGLITTQRAYEMSSKVIQTADEMLQRLSQMG